ncbi:hypothetical protein PG985_013988 [Apiospora marii]|uniref:uncharacterized protein n=1 Tax=Apiospora marii TaxID=335849 RepID=UPI00312DCCB0
MDVKEQAIRILQQLEPLTHLDVDADDLPRMAKDMSQLLGCFVECLDKEKDAVRLHDERQACLDIEIQSYKSKQAEVEKIRQQYQEDRVHLQKAKQGSDEAKQESNLERGRWAAATKNLEKLVGLLDSQKDSIESQKDSIKSQKDSIDRCTQAVQSYQDKQAESAGQLRQLLDKAVSSQNEDVYPVNISASQYEAYEKGTKEAMEKIACHRQTFEQGVKEAFAGVPKLHQATRSQSPYRPAGKRARHMDSSALSMQPSETEEEQAAASQLTQSELDRKHDFKYACEAIIEEITAAVGMLRPADPIAAYRRRGVGLVIIQALASYRGQSIPRWFRDSYRARAQNKNASHEKEAWGCLAQFCESGTFHPLPRGNRCNTCTNLRNGSLGAGWGI